MVAVQNCPYQGLNSPPTGEHIVRVGREQVVDEGCHFQLAQHHENQGQMSNGRNSTDEIAMIDRLFSLS